MACINYKLQFFKQLIIWFRGVKLSIYWLLKYDSENLVSIKLNKSDTSSSSGSGSYGTSTSVSTTTATTTAAATATATNEKPF